MDKAICLQFVVAICQFIEFLMDFCIYDDILDRTLIADEKFLHLFLKSQNQVKFYNT